MEFYGETLLAIGVSGMTAQPLTESARMKLRAEIWGTDMDRYVLRNPFIEIGDILVDVRAFFSTRAGCDMCGFCCSWGTSVSAETAERLAPHVQEIGERYIPAERRGQLGWHFAKDWDINYTNIVKVDSTHTGCCFLYKDGERYLCSIYSWAQATKREVFDYWPFECILYPVSVLPYKGILHEGKTLLTLRMAQSWHIIDTYGNTRPLQKSVLKRILFDLRLSLAYRLGKLGIHVENEDTRQDCYFKEGHHQKPLAYVYFEQQLRWYFGDNFYESMCAEAARLEVPAKAHMAETTEQ
jgi:hypothetical protein